MVILKKKKEDDIFDELDQQYKELRQELEEDLEGDFNEVTYNMLHEMATACHPKANGGKYPMFIRVEYTNGEHKPPHAHLYRPDRKPSPKGLITKFLITEALPRKAPDIVVMRGKPPVPPEYVDLIINWAKDRTKRGVNNWDALWDAWEQLEMTLR